VADAVRIAHYRDGDGDHLGVVDLDGGVVRSLDRIVPGERGGEGVLALINGGFDIASAAEGRATPLTEVRLLAPIPRPRRNLFCAGKNYREHAEELPRRAGATGEVVPRRPIVFTKPPSTVIGDGAAIFAHPGLTAELDYEAELAVIIGRGGRGIAAAGAHDHVWGYTVVNDVTARDLQRDHRQWFLGKGLDTFCPMGPWAVTADEFDLGAARVSCRVNGELRQDGAVRDLIFDVPTLIATISAGITLEPGDVIATGTPAGVGIGFDPPRFLRPGDVIETAVTGIGTLTNPVAS
jgi:2-keto-4-pentenoate hydratase/2-oxohepta-3-ene-1,7-dioic acid hydratase in catechol pathway